MAPAALLPLAPSPPHPSPPRRLVCRCGASRRGFTIHTAIAIASTSAAATRAAEEPAPAPQPPPKAPASKPSASLLSGLENTRSWLQHYGSGFSIRVPPSFDDIMEPEDFSAGTTYYGDKAKPRLYEARFASPDRDELVSVVIKPSNQLKITFLEAKDITDLGTLKDASKIFVPAGAKVYTARTIKVKDEEDIRTYYFYEFGLDKQHVALMATVNSGKVVPIMMNIRRTMQRMKLLLERLVLVHLEIVLVQKRGQGKGRLCILLKETKRRLLEINA